MLKKLLIISSTLISAHSFGASFLDRASSLKKLGCENIESINTQKELDQIMEKIASMAGAVSGSDRHKLNSRLNDCSPTKSSKGIIIAFEGTGAYEPRVPAVMGLALKCIAGKIDSNLIKNIYSTTLSSVALVDGVKVSELKWSGLNTGVLEELFSVKESRELDWFSYPSEESEVLSGLASLSSYSIRELSRDINRSVNGNPKGISNAVKCIRRYHYKSKALKIKPAIILTSHSSGARSVVKLSEKMKEFGLSSDLAFTIDPVREAHEIIKEIIPQKIGEPARYAQYEWDRYWGKKPDYPYSRVWGKSSPSSLYKPSNNRKMLSFYQRSDILGLKIGGDALRFGILGSYMDGADENNYVSGLGTSGHGEIAYYKDVTERFLEEVLKVLR